jgi:hypothetical protein
MDSSDPDPSGGPSPVGNTPTSQAGHGDLDEASPSTLMRRRRVRIVVRRGTLARASDSPSEDSSLSSEPPSGLALTRLPRFSSTESVIDGRSSSRGNEDPRQGGQNKRPNEEDSPTSPSKRPKNHHDSPGAPAESDHQSHRQWQGIQRERSSRSLDEMSFGQLQRLYSWVYDEDYPLPSQIQRQPLSPLTATPPPRSVFGEDERLLISPDVLERVLSLVAQRHEDSQSLNDTGSDHSALVRREEEDDEERGMDSDLGDHSWTRDTFVSFEDSEGEESEPYPGWLAERYDVDNPNREPVVKDSSPEHDGDAYSFDDDDYMGTNIYRAMRDEDNSFSDDPIEVEAAADFDRRMDYLGYARY